MSEIQNTDQHIFILKKKLQVFLENNNPACPQIAFLAFSNINWMCEYLIREPLISALERDWKNELHLTVILHEIL